MNADKINARKARLVDYVTVRNLNRGIYTGFDYLDYMFYEFLHNKQFDAFVGEWSGKVIGFVVYMTNGDYSVAMAARVDKELLGTGMGSAFLEKANNLYRILRPDVKMVVRSSSRSQFPKTFEEMISNPEERKYIIYQWFVLAFKFPRATLGKLPATDISTRLLSLSDVIQYVSQIRDVLFRDAPYFQHGLVWTPLTVTTGNIIRAARVSRTVVSMSPRGAVDQVSFSGSMPYRSDIYYYGSSTAGCLSHIYQHLRLIRAVTRDDSVELGLIVHFSYGLDFAVIEEDLQNYLGPRHSSDTTFKAREGLVYYKPFPVDAKY